MIILKMQWIQLIWTRRIASLLGVYVLVALLYLFATPVLEAPDEIYHVAMINYVANTGELPVQQVGADTDYRQEASQPPLYYLITGWLTRWIDRSDYDQMRYFNPHANIGQAERDGNKNRIIHIPTSSQNMVYLARMFSLLCGAVTIFAVYQSARQFAPHNKRLPLLATGLVLFNPQFLFISTAANNDILVVMFNTLSFWLVLIMLREGFDTRRSLLLSVFIALGTISKLSGLAMVIVGATAGLYVAYKRRDLRGLIILGVSMAGIWALLGAWWYIRNITLYDELFGTGMMLKVFGGRGIMPFEMWLETMLGEFGGLRWSYWAVFGWFNIITWRWVYSVIDMLSLVALVGFIGFLWQQRNNKPLHENMAFAGLMLTIGTISFISWTTQTTGTQGRLLFPFIAPASLFLALGFLHLHIRPMWVLAPLIALAIAQPPFIIRPVYAPPPIVDQLPPDAIGADIVFYEDAPKVVLVGYQLMPRRWELGDCIPIRLFWRPLAPTSKDYTLSLTAVLPDTTPIASVNAFPGWGSQSTTTWLPGVIYADWYLLTIPHGQTAVGDVRILLRWWDYPQGGEMRNSTNAEVFIFAGGINTAPTATLVGMVAPLQEVIFGENFRLLGHTIHEHKLSLLWEVILPTEDAYTVFAFALSQDTILAQGDSMPSMPTQFYRPRERFITHHTLIPAIDAPSGIYPLYIGWYRDAERLRVDAPDNMYRITDITLP